MNVRTESPLTVNGVALGATRAEVEALCGRATTNANPAWARYHLAADSSLGLATNWPLLVGFAPDRARGELQAWTVQSVCGSVLACKDTVLLKLGDGRTQVRARLGEPEEEFECEPGVVCLVYDDCVVTYDVHTERTIELALRSPFELGVFTAANTASERHHDAWAC